jgi:glycosyltransferase involved in cell wall biosynthesis
MTAAGSPIRLSLGVPTYQRASLLKNMLARLIAEVRRHPRRQEMEICLSDNGSTDETPMVIADQVGQASDVNIRHVRQSTNLGFAGNFAAVAQLATGQGFVVLADDDTLEPDAIDHLVRAVDRLSSELPLIIWNTLPGGDAVDRKLQLPTQETLLTGPDEALQRLGIFHTSFITNLMFHRESALAAWRPAMAMTRYPHTALAAALLVDRPAVFLPTALTKVHLPPDTWDQPLLTAIDMARVQTDFVLADSRCRRWAGWVYRFLVRMLPTAVYLHRLGKCRGNPSNPFADLSLGNVRSCYCRSFTWQTVATCLWLAAFIAPVSWLGGLLRRWSRHPR